MNGGFFNIFLIIKSGKLGIIKLSLMHPIKA